MYRKKFKVEYKNLLHDSCFINLQNMYADNTIKRVNNQSEETKQRSYRLFFIFHFFSFGNKVKGKELGLDRVLGTYYFPWSNNGVPNKSFYYYYNYYFFFWHA